MPAKTFEEILKTTAAPTGCGVLVLKDGKVLTGTRKERASRGQICGPGGHIEPGETPEEAARREAMEEFNIECHDLRPLGVQDGGRHGTSAVFLCTDYTGKPRTDEEEMTNPKWLTIRQIRALDAFPPFLRSLELLPRDTVRKFNPYHDPDGRSSSTQGGETMKAIEERQKSEGIQWAPKEEETQKAFRIYKADEDQRLVFGWASVAITVDGTVLEDRQHDTIDPEDLEEAAYEYVLNFRDTGEEHLPGYRKKGRLVESCVFTPEKQRAMGLPEGALPVAWWIGFKIDDEDTWQRIKDGTYKMFSIEGRAQREPIEKADSTARSFDEVLKFNPYHDAAGRFASSSGATSMTVFTNSPAGQKAIANIKAKLQAAGDGSSTQAAAPQKPQKTVDSLGFADYDDADYHELYNGKAYYQQQKLSPTQKAAANNYLEAHTEPYSLYSHSQNLNHKMATDKPLTGKYQATHDGLMSAMHNIGYNVELTRYDHDGMINSLLKTLGAGNNYENMTEKALKKALIGQEIQENKFLSTSYNGFKNAPASSKKVFDTRAVRIIYRAKAGTQAMMPGTGPGGDLGELILAPTNGKANKAGKIVDVRMTGEMARRKGTQNYDQERIEIVIELP